MTKPKHKYNFWLLPDGFLAITLGNTIYWNCTKQELDSRWDAKAKIEHELVHIRQIAKLGMFRFYSSYIYSYLKGLLKYFNHTSAYMNIPYEVEAYKVEREVRAVIRENLYVN